MPLTLRGFPFSSSPAEGIRFTNLCPSAISKTKIPWPPYWRSSRIPGVATYRSFRSVEVLFSAAFRPPVKWTIKKTTTQQIAMIFRDKNECGMTAIMPCHRSVGKVAPTKTAGARAFQPAAMLEMRTAGKLGGAWDRSEVAAGWKARAPAHFAFFDQE